MTGKSHEGRPYQGGSQPTQEHPPEVPTKGRTGLQLFVIVVAALVLIAAVLWLVVPLGS